MLYAFGDYMPRMIGAGMLHWTLVLGSSAPAAAVPGSASRPAHLALPPPRPANQVIGHSGSLPPDQAAQAGLDTPPAEHLMQATVSGLHSDLLNQLAVLANGNAGVQQHSLPAVHATQPMQPSSSYTDLLLSSVLFQSSSASGQPASPAPEEAPQQVAYPASRAADARTIHQVTSARQTVDAPASSNIRQLGVAMQLQQQHQQQQQGSVLGPTTGSGALHGSAAPHTSAFLPYHREPASESSTGGGALSGVSGLMRQDIGRLQQPQPMVPVTGPHNVLRDSPLSENLPG